MNWYKLASRLTLEETHRRHLARKEEYRAAGNKAMVLMEALCLTEECKADHARTDYPKRKKSEDCECAHSMDMHCDGGDDGW